MNAIVKENEKRKETLISKFKNRNKETEKMAAAT